jgi:hypothetical protein
MDTLNAMSVPIKTFLWYSIMPCYHNPLSMIYPSTKEHSYKEYSKEHYYGEISFKERSSKEPFSNEKSLLPSSSLSSSHPLSPIESKLTEVQKKLVTSETKYNEVHVLSHEKFQQLILRLFRNLSENNLKNDHKNRSIIVLLVSNLKAAYTFFRSEVYI